MTHADIALAVQQVADKIVQGLFLGAGAVVVFLVVVAAVLWLNRAPR